MSLKQSLHFDTAVTPIAAVIAAVQAAYGASTVAATPGLPIADNPASGTDDNEAGTGGSFDPNTADADGLPWDERIHSGGKTRTSKGVWTKKKGVQPAFVAQVAAELRARSAQGGAVTQPAATLQPVGAPATGLPALGGMPALTPPVQQLTPFESLIHFIAEQQRQRPEFTATYVSDSLKSWGFVDEQGNGSTAKLQNQAPEVIANVRAAFAQVLGLPVGS